jgi:hypothetical protein
MPVVQWAAGCKAIALGDGMVVAQLTAQCHLSVAQSKFLYFRLVFFFAKFTAIYSHPPLTFATLMVFHS